GLGIDSGGELFQRLKDHRAGRKADAEFLARAGHHLGDLQRVPAQLVSRARKELGISLSARAVIFETLEQLAAGIDAKAA
ncbi:MAG: hypothetical protein AAFV96_03890, partial [Pseudomonadota bacterium]